MKGCVPVRRVRRANEAPDVRAAEATWTTRSRNAPTSAGTSIAGLIETTPNTRPRIRRAASGSAVWTYTRASSASVMHSTRSAANMSWMFATGAGPGAASVRTGS